MGRVCFYRFGERYDSLQPSDEDGALDDLSFESTAPPIVTDTPTGRARSLSVGLGLNTEGAADNTPIELTRTMSVLAMVDIDWATMVTGDIGYIAAASHVALGVLHYPWAFRVEILDPATYTFSIRLVHTDGGTVVLNQEEAVVLSTPDFALLGASRFQEDGEMRVQYFCNGQASDVYKVNASDTFAIDDQGGDALYVGYNIDNSGSPDTATAFTGDIDMLAIYDEQLAPEFVRHTYEMFNVHYPRALRTLKAMLPGEVYSDDPTSAVQRELKVEAAGLAYAKAEAHALEAYVPDRAYGFWLEHWEELHRLPRKATDSIDERRTRVLKHTQSVLGYSVEDVKLLLEDFFGLDSADISLRQHDNEYTEDFSDATDWANSWLVIDGVPSAAPAVSGGVLTMGSSAVDDYRYHGIARTDAASLVLHAIDGGSGIWHATWRCDAFGIISNNDFMVGMAIGDRVKDQWLFVGLYDDGIADAMGYITYKDGTLSGINGLANVTAAGLAVRCIHNGDGTYDFGWQATTPPDDALDVVGLAGPENPGWVGFAALSPTGSTLVSTVQTVDLDDFFIYTPEGRQRYDWQAYRDSALSGTYNLDRAQQLINRIQQAGTRGSAIDDITTQFTAEDSGSLTNRDTIKLG